MTASPAWIDELLRCDSAESRGSILRQAPEGAAAAIQSRLVSLLYSDLAAAKRLAQAGDELAHFAPDQPLAAAYAKRGAAHLAYVEGAYQQAAEQYDAAARAFASLGAATECARTQSSGLQSLILLSRYEQALDWAQEAERTFLQSGDLLRLARLDSNIGNLYFRQDRVKEAVARYHGALEGFRSAGDAKDIAAVLSNLAVAHTNLGEFREALAAYTEARDHCRRHGLAPLEAQADYNIAYLYFLRGDYSEARRLYQISRQHCEEAGDAYHLALCDLDEAEMSLELNLTEEGESLARRAAAQFEALCMQYERGKALVSVAVAGSQRGEFQNPDRILRHARELFQAENNEVWPALIDLLRAVLAFHAHKYSTARRLSSLAWRTLAHTRMPGRAAHCQILRGRLWLDEGLADRARATAREAVAMLGDAAPSPLRFHAKLLEGDAEESQGRWSEAKTCYETARRELEDMRGRLDTDDLRISLLRDKLAVYEGLIHLHLETPLYERAGSVDQALMLVQQAKSRSLADRLLRIGATPASGETAAIETLRQDLNWCYRQIELAILIERAGHPQSPLTDLKARARAIETELLRLHAGTAVAVPDTDSLLRPAESSEDLRAAIPSGTVVMEYFESRGRLYLFLVTRGTVKLVRLGSMDPIRQAMKLLQFQLGKYRTSAGEQAVNAALPAVRHHLASLHAMLVAPARAELTGYRHWVVALHREMHGVPFAALEKDGVCLLDQVEIVHTPSASVFAACRNRPAPPETGAWVMAVPDSRSPNIQAEAAQVAALIPNAQLLFGDAATAAAFRQAASHCAILHLATHGVFRRDNPMFSSLQLADAHLSLFDLSRAQLNAGLVVLSGCNTGSAISVGGDELLGLMRGFLAAGARSLLVSLWEVNDRSTTEFMVGFYTHLQRGERPATALRKAASDLRARRPHPYYWAPFILVGAVVAP